ncbi:MAG TPA: DUF4157 domain-containing protein [Mucilaginibacter sp.]|jgi:hypothetical protein|nr:DUF4157 domain-containing protein [Mucilaginibacter sp.]
MFEKKENIKSNRIPASISHGRAFFQPKLTVNQPNDIYEQEADYVADKVMRMTDDSVNQNGFFKPATDSLQRKCQACEEEDKFVHRKEKNGNDAQSGNDLDSYIGSLNSSGQPLPDSSRKFFEPKFGRDFSNVRLHTDSVAAKSAQSINALAYTSGNNIVFNSGQFSPESDNGKKLLAHELTHVIQQGAGPGTAVQRKPGDSCGKDFLYQFDAVANTEQEKDHRGVPRLLYTSPTGKQEDVAKYFQNTPIRLTPGMSFPAGQTSKYGWRAVCYSPTAGAPEMIYWVLDEYLSKPNKTEPKNDDKPVTGGVPAKEEPKKDAEPKKDEQQKDAGWWDYCPAPAPDVDDKIVQDLIDEQIKLNTDKATGKINLDMAFSALNAERNKKEHCCDVNLAAAERYMYARLEMAAGRSLAYQSFLNLGDSLAKLIHTPVPNSGVCPKTRTSAAQLAWGFKGTADGKADYDKAHGGAWGTSPTNRFPDGTWYDPSGKMHMGPGPKW